MADTSPPKERKLQPQSYVRIEGLVAAPQFNGKIGVVQSFQGDSGRYRVKCSAAKTLAVKPEKLVLLCSNCKTKDVDENTKGHYCPRCEVMPYCSESCQNNGWNVHKARCVPKHLPEPPEPVNDADTGSPVLIANQEYLNMAIRAGEDGRIAEEIALLESMATKDERQPAPYMNLFFRYAGSKYNGMDPNNPSNKIFDQFQDYDKAFECLSNAVWLFVNPKYGMPSDPDSVDLFPATPTPPSDANFSGHQVDNLEDSIGLLIRNGTGFITENRVIGRSGSQLVPEAQVLEAICYLGFNTKHLDQCHEAFRITHEILSDTLLELGNIHRKINNCEKAIRFLRLSDVEMQKHYTSAKCSNAEQQEDELQKHNYQALLLLCEVLSCDASADSNTLEQSQQKQQLAVDEARKTMNLMITDNHPMIYRAQITLANMMHNQIIWNLKEDPEKEISIEVTKEIRILLEKGGDQAQAFGDEQYFLRANAIMRKYASK